MGVQSHPLVHCGRFIGSEEVEAIRDTVSTCCRLSRTELAATICEHLDWRSASGSLKRDAGLKLLEKLEGQGLLNLPLRRPRAPGAERKKQPTPPPTPRTQAAAPIEGRMAEIGMIHLVTAASVQDVALWNEYVSRYHYLGYAPPIGCFHRYFIESQRGLLGCLLFCGAAKSLRARDRWIGWSKDERLRNLGLVINNSRFLIFPWVRVKNLASHALGQAARRLGQDWQQHWGYRPLLMETFVDPQRYAGTCYLAANWQDLGTTSGLGLARRGKSYSTTPKKIFVKPLAKDFRSVLCA